MQISLGKNSYLDEPNAGANPFDGEVRIGNYSYIAAGVVFLGGRGAACPTSLHRDAVSSFAFSDALHWEGYYTQEDTAPIEIGHDVWIGRGAMILPGVTIGNGAIVGAGCVVSKDVPAYAVVVGNPMRVVRYRFEPEVIEKLESIHWWWWPTQILKARMEQMKDVRVLLECFANRQQRLVYGVEMWGK